MKISTITKLSAVLALATTILSMSNTASAAAFMKLGDIKGEAASTDNEHNDWIIIESVAHELSRDQTTGEISEVIRIKRQSDANSPRLLQAMLDGSEFPEISIGAAELDKDGKPVRQSNCVLHNVLISSWSTSGNADPSEEITLNYTKMEYSSPTAAEGAESNAQADYFAGESLSFGVEREMKESGEKSGTDNDLLIGNGPARGDAEITLKAR